MKKATRRTLLIEGSVFVGGLVLGIVAGFVSGVLYAPQSGEDTREHLRKQADELGEAIKDTGQDILAAGKHHVSSALQRGHEAVVNAL